MTSYHIALQQLDELIAHFRSQNSVSCAIAEQKDSILIKLADCKADLKPEDQKAFADIAQFYQRHIVK